jgi:hypothetical protein
MNAAWRGFSDELARWRDAGRPVEFWWRDDDAARPDPALDRLCALAERAAVPLALAVVPAQAEAEAFASAGAMVSLIQHGSDHRNRAGPDEKKTEFPGAETPEAAVARLVAARDGLRERIGARLLPVLAPPWNRLPATHAAPLAAGGFRGLSRYGARAATEAAPGLRQVNTHVDLVAWKAGRGFAGEATVLDAATAHLAAKRTGKADSGEATGWLSHHAVHDDAAWSFLARLFDVVGATPGVRWLTVQALFHVS